MTKNTQNLCRQCFPSILHNIVICDAPINGGFNKQTTLPHNKTLFDTHPDNHICEQQHVLHDDDLILQFGEISFALTFTLSRHRAAISLSVFLYYNLIRNVFTQHQHLPSTVNNSIYID